MGKIKKILENELVGGTQSTDVYPVTSIKAVYDESNERLDHILNRRGTVNISTNYNSDHTAETLTLSEAIGKVPTSDRTLGFVGTFLTVDGWQLWQFEGSAISEWSDTSKWNIVAKIGDKAERDDNNTAISREESYINTYDSYRTQGYSIIPDSELSFTEQDGYINSSGDIVEHGLYKTKVYAVTPKSVVCVHGYQRGISGVGIYGVYTSEGVSNAGLIFVRKLSDYSNQAEGAILVRVNDIFVVPDNCKNIAVSYVINENDNGLFSVKYTEDVFEDIANQVSMGFTKNQTLNKLIKEIYITGVDRGTVSIKNIHRQGAGTSDARGYIVGQVGDTAYNIVLEDTPRVPDGDNNIIKATAGSATIYFLIDWGMLDPGTGTNNNDFYELSDDAYTLSANPQIAEYLSAEFHSLAPEDLIEGKYVYQINGSIYEASSYNIYVYPISANRRYRIKGELHGTTTFAIYSNYSDGELSGLLYLFSKNENANIPIDEIIQGYNGYLAVSWNSLNVDVYTDGLDNIFSDIEDLQYRLASNAKLASVGSMQGYINENGGFVEHGSYTADSYTLVAGEKYRILGTYQGVKGVAALSFWSDSTFRKTIVDTNAITNVGSTISIDTYFTVPLGINKAYVTNTYGNTLFLYKVDKVDKVDNIEKQFNDVASLSVIVGDVIEPDSSVASTYLNDKGNLSENSSYTVRKYTVEHGQVFKVRGSTRGTSGVACYALYTANEVTSVNLYSIYTIKDFVGSDYKGARQATIDHFISVPERVVLIVTCSVPSDKDDMLLYDLQNTKDYIDEVNSTAIKYVDCLGDSLTMGATRFGWYEDTLQELLGSGYKVRNWGVGGESSASIMARQGSDCIKFQEDWVLKADGSNTLVMNTEDNNLIIKTQTYGLNVALLLQGAENDSEQRTRVVNPCYINGIECTMSYTQASAYAKGRWYIKRNEVGDRDITIPANTPVYFNTGKEMGKSDITIIWMGTNDGTYSNWQDLVDKQVKIGRAHV